MSGMMVAARAGCRPRLAGRARKAVLTTHIASAVALLGTTIGLTVMGIRTGAAMIFGGHTPSMT